MIETRVIHISADRPNDTEIFEAAEVLRNGGLVAFPTETVYGLGADALSPEAVNRVFAVKGRPSDNPLIVHVASPQQVSDFADEIPPIGEELARKFWPGPLTLVVKKTVIVPDNVSTGLPTVAIRMPNHPVALKLINAFNGGIVGPSANLSGRPSPTDAAHVVDDLGGSIEMVLDAGPSTIGLESTVVDVTVDPPMILRIGSLPIERIAEVAGTVTYAATAEGQRRSPGTRYRHYAPGADVVVVAQSDKEDIGSRLSSLRQQGKKVGCIVHSRELSGLESGEFYRVLPADPELLARYLFRTIRDLDRSGIEVLLIEAVEESGLGAAVMDRIRKASRTRVPE